MLIDHEIYFDICQIIFPELNIKLIKIQEYHGLNSTQKLQYLIDLLAQELHIDLSYISGNAIMNYDLEHIHKFLDLLLQYSMKYMEDKNPNRKRVNSDPPKDNSEDVSRNLHSARGPGSRKEDDYYLSRTKIDHEKEEEQQDYLKSTKRKKKQT